MNLRTHRWMPDERYASVWDVPWERLKDQGISTLLLDLDNTLGPWGMPQLEAQTIHRLRALKHLGFRLGILSNSRQADQRAMLLDQLGALNVPLVCHARKPAKGGYLSLLATLRSSPQEALMVGDQWVTDILGAKRLGMRAILVEPFDPASEPWWARLRRKVEQRLV